MPAALKTCLYWCEGRKAPHTVITANAGILCMMRDDPQLARACRAGDLNLADGMSVVWTLKASGIPVPERVTGVDLMARLLEEGGPRGLSVYFLGAEEATVKRLAALCPVRYPGLVVAGYRNGFFRKEEEDSIVEDIRASGAHMLFVGMPSPVKEVFCERHRDRLAVPLVMGVGGSFDVLTGRIPRAPALMRRSGLEWAWRLLMEPRRMWRRYLTTNSRFLWLAFGEVLRKRFGGARGAGLLPPAAGEHGP